MPDSIYDKESLSIQNCKKDGLIVLEENESRDPMGIMLQLAEKPKVKPIPYGPYAGEFAVWIRLSFSPLDGFPYEHEGSRKDDPNGLRMTVGELIDLVDNKAPNNVYIVGGEPLFKWDDEVKHLVEPLLEKEYGVAIETSGVVIPDSFECNSFGAYVVIKPQLFDAVPSEEFGGYMQWMEEAMRRWIDMDVSRHFHFDIDTRANNSENIFDTVANIAIYMGEAFDENDAFDEYIIFTPQVAGYLDYRALREQVGKLLLNFEETRVSVQMRLE